MKTLSVTEASKVEKSLSPSDLAVIKAKWKQAFNGSITGEQDRRNAKKYSRAEINEMISLFEQSPPSKNRAYYHKMNKFDVKSSFLDGKEIKHLLHEGNVQNASDASSKLVCATEDMFDVIYASHSSLGHRAIAATHNDVKKIGT